MSIFISWSGKRSQRIAEALAKWIPEVIQVARVFMSSQDIPPGRRWGWVLADNLKENVGILCLTKENLSAPWILFEAGALSKSVEESQVIPLLHDLPKSALHGPLAQFQALELNENGLLGLMKTVNAASGSTLSDAKLIAQFERIWPALKVDLAVDQFNTDAAVFDSRTLSRSLEHIYCLLRTTRDKDGVESKKAEADIEYKDGIEIRRKNNEGAIEIEVRPVIDKRFTIPALPEREFKLRFDAKVSGSPHKIACVAVGPRNEDKWEWLNWEDVVIDNHDWKPREVKLKAAPNMRVLFRLHETMPSEPNGGVLHIRNVIVWPTD